MSEGHALRRRADTARRAGKPGVASLNAKAENGISRVEDYRSKRAVDRVRDGDLSTGIVYLRWTTLHKRRAYQSLIYCANVRHFHGSYPASFKIQRLRGNFQGTNLIPLKPGHAGV